VTRWVDGSNEYPGVRAVEGGNLVFSKLESHFRTSGAEMSEKEAAQAIEADLRKFYDKLHAVYGVPQANPTLPAATQAPTLTNQHAAPPPAAPTGEYTFEQALRDMRFVET
jgi:hypothetical protein